VLATCVGLAAAHLAGCASQPLPANLPTENPAGFARKYQIKRVGSLEIAPLYFEGQRLFDISAPASRDPNAYPPVAARLDVIQDHLSDVVPAPTGLNDLFQPPPTRYDPSTFEVKIGQHNGYVTLSASDRSGAQDTPLLTLTDQDAKYNGVGVNVLAHQWADTLQSVLVEALRQRHPISLGDIVAAVLLVLAIAAIASLALVLLKSLVKRQLRVVEDRLALTDEASTEREGVGTLRSRLRLARTALVVIDWVLNWALVIVWAFGLLAILRALPAGQGVARQLSARALSIVVIWLVAGIVNGVGRVLVARAARAWQERPLLSLDEAGRRELRLPTIVRSLEYVKTLTVYAAAIALTLGQIGASTSAVVTLGAGLAFAISFGAQSLVKDLVNGFFILVEDQYAIGDYVGFGTVAGVIEAVTLRITQLRTDDGRLVTIPNSQVAVVENYTRSWSRSDYRLAVAIDSDLPHALKVFERVLFELADEPRWRKIIPQPPRVLGVETMASTGIVMRAWVQTAPGQMFAVTREINRRMLEAMSDEGVTLAMPTTRTFAAPPPAAPPAGPEPAAQRDGESERQGGAPGAAATAERSGGEPT
jgi:small conductance mechanosensitive channel